MNKTVIKLLEEATGAIRETKRVVHHDLDRFFGTWTKEEADAFDEALREQRQTELESFCLS
jgi:DNA-binding ferritin-like protein (Dps family)